MRTIAAASACYTWTASAYRAQRIISTVEAVERAMAHSEQSARSCGESFLHYPALIDTLKNLTDPVGKTMYYEYRALYRAHFGNREAIAAALHRKTFGQTSMTRTQLHFVDTLILRFYGRKPRLSPLLMYNIAKSVFQRMGGRWVNPDRCSKDTGIESLTEALLDTTIPIEAVLTNQEHVQLLDRIVLPSRSWLYNYLKWFVAQPNEGKLVLDKRLGKGTWDRHNRIFDTYVTKAMLPLEYVFADHYLIDAFIVDEATRSQLNRLWLTLLIDVFTRSILGMAILYEPPCIESIQTALQHAIWPKTSHLQHGIEQAWTCYGIPQRLFLDNAWAHHSHSLETLSRAIGRHGQYNTMHLDWRPPYKARYGALIESLFGNIARQIKQAVPGAIVSSDQREIRDAAANACWLYGDIHRIIHQIILDYQHTPQRTLGGLTPHEKWEAGIREWGLPHVPPLTQEMERLFWRLDPNPRVIRNYGVAAFGLHYTSPELDNLPRYTRDSKYIKYFFRYKPSNIACIGLWHDDHWVADAWAKELRLADDSTRSVSIAERKIAAVLAYKGGQSTKDWLAYINDVDLTTQRRRVERHEVEQRATVRPRRKQPIDVATTADAVVHTPYAHDSVYDQIVADFFAD